MESGFTAAMVALVHKTKPRQVQPRNNGHGFVAAVL